MKRVIICGGTGLIGRGLAKTLTANGYDVTILSRSLHQEPVEGAKIAAWDGKTTKGWGKLVDGAVAVINLAGQSLGGGLWTPSLKAKIMQSRISAGAALVMACREALEKPKVLVQASAVGYYGTSGDQALMEDAPAGKDFLAGVCVEWEKATHAVEEMGIRWAAVRTGLVLGKKGSVLDQFLLPIRLFVGGRLGSGRQWYSWIHLQDELNAVRYILENEELKGPVNLTAPGAVQMEEFGRTLARTIGRPYWIPAPAFAIRIVLGEMSMLVLEGQRVAPGQLIQSGYEFKFARLEEALEDLLKT